MTTVLCTLYNSLYLDKGLVLYDSLCECAKDFKLYVLCMDDKCYDVLSDLNLEHHIPIRLSEFERDDLALMEAKANRSFGEYCWTCSSSLILYILEKYNEPICTYIDSDLYFYKDPQILIDEMFCARKSVLITPHRFTKENKHLEVNGIYCVEFNAFVNNSEALEVLRKWRNDCLECCTSENDGEHFGDQKYLDEWPTIYNCVYVCPHLGAGVAPWNIKAYKLHVYDANNVQLYSKIDKDIVDLVFYHYHYITFIDEDTVNVHVAETKVGVQLKLVRSLYIDYLKRIQVKRKDLEVLYGVESMIKHHPAYVWDTKMSVLERIKNYSFQKLKNRLLITYNRRKDIYRFCEL